MYLSNSLLLMLLFLHPFYLFTQNCTSCTFTFTGSGSSYNLNNGEKLCIASGIFTGSIGFNGAATICVENGATFSPSNFNNFGNGSVINNYGNITFQNSISIGGGATINNEGTITFANNPNLNGAISFNNQSSGYWQFNNAFTLQNAGSNFINYGSIKALSDFSVQQGTFLTSYGKIETSGNFNPQGGVTNNGSVLTAEFININSGGNFVNSCIMVARRGFNNNDDDTENNGFIWVTGTSGFPNDLIQNNAVLKNTGIIRTVRFINNNVTITNTPSGSIRVDGTSACGACNQSVNQGTITGGFVSDNSNAPGYLFDVNTGTVTGTYTSLPAYDTTNVTVTGCYTPLPLTLLYVICKKDMQLSWETQDERDVNNFWIERSADGIHFQAIKNIPAQNQYANTYTFTDTDPLPGLNYYRLDMVDLDGSSTKSDIVVCESEDARRLNISYNTYIINMLQVNVSTPLKSISLWSIDGKLLLQKQGLESPSVELTCSQLSPGIYIVQVVTDQGQREVIRVIKQ